VVVVVSVQLLDVVLLMPANICWSRSSSSGTNMEGWRCHRRMHMSSPAIMR
jgi:hypothetical protein